MQQAFFSFWVGFFSAGFFLAAGFLIATAFTLTKDFGFLVPIAFLPDTPFSFDLGSSDFCLIHLELATVDLVKSGVLAPL